VIAENPFGAFSDRIYLIGGSSRAEKYLNYIVALTGATQTNNHYALDVGKTRFYLGDRYVRRQRDSKNPEYGYDETCFYSAYEGMPRTEEIATLLLQLKSNPALFDQWASQNGLAYKADGHVFGRAQ